MLSKKGPTIVAIHWPRFGPYHLARLRAACAALKNLQVEVMGLEIASHDQLYSWREESAGDLMKHVVFPGRTYEEISPIEILRGLEPKLSLIRPDVIAINGYSSSDSLGILLWCRLNHCPAILMTESKEDDTPRSGWREWLKRRTIARFSAALCGGRLHRSYLERLGMNPGRVYEGYDVIDNDYFWQGAETARQLPAAQRALPGLEEPAPFFLASARFLKRKNLDGLLHAYACYRRLLDGTRDEHLPWRLVILGDGVERPALEHLVHIEGIRGVSFPGFRQVDELPIYYGLAAVFVHPAIQEQWGLVVNEAMAAGLPVLVSNCCGCVPELVCDGANGFTFPPDDTGMLASLMVRMSSNKVDLPAMGAASRECIQEWGPQRFAYGLQRAVQVVLGAGRPAPRAGAGREPQR
jgi:1,2-diacylglycerol 3-alpha-glucosyltransferase